MKLGEANNQDILEEEEFEKVDVKGNLNGLKLRNGIHLSNGCMNLASIKNLKLSSQDIIVATYPKSGTTWTQEIVWLIMNNLDFEQANSASVMSRYVWIDSGLTPRQAQPQETPRFIKTHLPVVLLPENLIESKAKVICVIRNPKDILVSGFYFRQKLKKDRFIGTFEDLVDNFIEGKFSYGPWWEHVDGYAELPNALIIHYEDLIEKPQKTIRKIAAYLGKHLNQTQIQQIVEFTRFENFKEREEQKVLETAKDYFDSDLSFFRNGKSGDWSGLFNPESAKRFDNEINMKLKYFKIGKKARLIEKHFK